MKIGYVCTNYNNSPYTREAVASLIANRGHDIHVVVVDNQSKAEDVAALQEIAREFANVTVIYNDRNLGYFSGLNVGIAHVRKSRPDIDWLIVGNNDLKFPDDFLDVLEQNVPHLSEHAVVSPDIFTTGGEHQNPHVITGISKVREIFYDLYFTNYYLGLLILKLAKLFPWLSDRPDERQWRIPRHIYQGHGASYLLGPRFFTHFTELWAPTFMMYEEYFLSKQLDDVGLKVYYEPAIRVVHDCHGSLRNVPSKRRWDMAREAHKEYRKFVRIFAK